MRNDHAVENDHVGRHLVEHVLRFLSLASLVRAIGPGRHILGQRAGNSLGNGVGVLRIDQCVSRKLDRGDKQEHRGEHTPDISPSPDEPKDALHEQP